MSRIGLIQLEKNLVKMKDVSIKKNLSLQTAYQILNTILPLITAPYLARVLGAEQLGVFSFTSSVVSYFALFAMLGTVNYGTRCIAAVKDNRESLSCIFSEIFCLQIITSSIALTAYILYYFFFATENQLIVLIQGIAVLSCFFDVNWLFFGTEDFKLPVARNFIIRVATVAAILFFVKQEDDLWLYALLMLGSTLISQVVLWFKVKKKVDLVIPVFKNIFGRIKPNVVLFIPLLAMSVYHAMDKTMLGVLSSYRETGLYYNADKIVNIPLCVLIGVGTVMLPRMTALFNTKKEDANELFLNSLDGICFLSIAMCFGISAIAQDFIPFFFGKGYEDCIALTIILSIVIVIKGISNSVRTQYLIPLKYEKIFIQSVLIGAVLNLFVNIIFIPLYGALGACIGTVVAELVASVWQMKFIHKFLLLRKIYANSAVYALFGCCMFVLVRFISLINTQFIYKIIIEIIVGGGFYIGTNLVYWRLTNNKLLYMLLKRNEKQNCHP